jgi:cell division protein FtsI/penicillin-binding protein 2
MLKPAKAKSIALSPNRLNLVLTIIFLLSLAVVVRLFNLQINQHSLYKDRADNQQQLESALDPTRGNIYINNYSPSLGTSTLSALATNKNFAILYAVPEDFDSQLASSTVNKIYELFDKVELEKRVDAKLALENREELNKEIAYIDSLSLSAADKEAQKNEVLAKRDSQATDPTWQEFQKMKRELEINDQRQLLLNGYLEKLTKPDDPYEVLEKKVPADKLLEFYASLLTSDAEVITAETLEIRNNKIFKKTDEANSQAPGLIFKGLGYEMTPYRYYPEENLASHLLGFVNYENKGNYGLEEYFNQELSGTSGYIKAEKGGGSQSIVIFNDREYTAPIPGSDVVLTINRAVEFQICQKLEDSWARYKYDSATIIIVQPATGEIIAMCSWPQFDPNNYQDVKDIKTFDNPAVAYQYEPGSVFKSITMAAALDQNKVTPDTTYNDLGKITISGWSKPITNSDYDVFGGHGITSMKVVLEKSLNTGAIFAMQQIGVKIFSDYIKNFGFGEKMGIELPSEASGNIKGLTKDKVRPIDAATASFGQGLAVTPLQMLMSYAAIANNGILMKPYLVKQIINPDGSTIDTKPQAIRQVISERAATTLKGMLTEVVENGHSKKASVAGYYVAGKTGTAQVASKNGGYQQGNYVHTFIGFAPVDKPQFVMLVKLDHPKGFQYAESSATPIFGEIADFLLKYYQIPKQR